MWLCVPGPRDPDPALPIWATRTIEAFSRPGDRVIVRGHGAHASLPGEVAALIGAATVLGRHPLALLPTPASANRTRALLAATTPTPAGLAVPAGSAVTGAVAAATPRETAARTTSMATPTTATPAATSTAATRAGVATAGVAAATPTGPVAAAPGAAGPTGSAGPVVGVSRRRPARASGAGLVVVLAGPVTPGARGPRRPIPSRALAAWSAALRPGGILAVLTPPQIGHRRWGPPPGGVVAAAQDIGLAYTAHIVLVHTPVHDGQLQRPDSPRRPHAPFWTVHTDLFALRREPLDPFDTITATEQTERTAPADQVEAGAEPVTAPIPLHPPGYPAGPAAGAPGDHSGDDSGTWEVSA